MPPVIGALLAANVLMFLAQLWMGDVILLELALWPLETARHYAPLYGDAAPGFAPWQLVSYGFLHGNLLHLGTNMFALWMFGIAIEAAWGSRRFLIFYFVCVVGAGLVQLAVTSYTGSLVPTVGASGAVFGILLAFGMMFPNQRILLLIPPIPIKAKWFVILYGAFSLWAGITGSVAEVAHFAHLGGMLFGLVLIQYWRGKLPLRPRQPMWW